MKNLAPTSVFFFPVAADHGSLWMWGRPVRLPSFLRANMQVRPYCLPALDASWRIALAAFFERFGLGLYLFEAMHHPVELVHLAVDLA